MATEFGMVMFCNDVQFMNAHGSMEVTEVVMATVPNMVHSEKASLRTTVTQNEMTTDVMPAFMLLGMAS